MKPRKAVPVCCARSLKTCRSCRCSPGARLRSVTMILTTLEDLGSATCGKACYECLLDYGNQPDHKDLDRQLIRGSSRRALHERMSTSGGPDPGPSAWLRSVNVATASLNSVGSILLTGTCCGYRAMPSICVPNLFTQPDFFYRESNTAIYIDGPPHDEPDQMRRRNEINAAADGSGLHRDPLSPQGRLANDCS